MRSVILPLLTEEGHGSPLNNDSDLTFHDLNFCDEYQGWGLDMRKKIVVHTNDGGETWTTQLELKIHMTHIFLNRNDGWL